jgi:hypothetical protein
MHSYIVACIDDLLLFVVGWEHVRVSKKSTESNCLLRHSRPPPRVHCCMMMSSSETFHQFMTDPYKLIFQLFVLNLHPLALSLFVSSCVSYHRVKPIIAKNHVKFPFHSLPATVVRRHRIVDIFPTVSCLEHIFGET